MEIQEAHFMPAFLVHFLTSFIAFDKEGLLLYFAQDPQAVILECQLRSAIENNNGKA